MKQITPKFYTIEEARAALPRVKQFMQSIQDARSEIMELRPAVWPALSKAAGNGGSREAGELLPLFQKLEKGVKGIMGMGIIVKDVDNGIIDFLGRRKGRKIFICWRHGEENLTYWHDVNAGFSGRQPIDSDID